MLLGTYGPRVSEASREQETHLRHKERERGWERSEEERGKGIEMGMRVENPKDF